MKRFAFFPLFLVTACGGSHTPPNGVGAPPPSDPAAVPNASAADMGTSPPADADAAVASSPPPTDAGAASEAAPPSGGGAAAPGNEIISDDSALQDRCSKVAMPLEKALFEKFNACYQEGKKTNPNLDGTIKISIIVNRAGKVTSTKVAGGTNELGKKVTDCMLKAAKAEKYDPNPCAGATISIAKVYGTPH